jgi:hypothetical protein
MLETPPATRGQFRTRGHDRAVAAVRAMLAGRAPHALLVGGPPGVGKTTLALDLAAGLLCDAPDPADRPCRACRACRLVDRGRHPDLHRLAPTGPGDQIRIGDRNDPEDGTVRRLGTDLALLPVEGRARVAIIERADRLGDDAQTALLKTLEEPPSGVTIVLCADDEDRLMPTVRSRCARIRLGPLAVRDVERLLVDDGVVDPPLAARLARLSAGRPGLARSLARSPDAVAIRDEMARVMLDLLGATPAARLVAARELVRRASELDAALAEPPGDDVTFAVDGAAPGPVRGRRSRRGAARPGASGATSRGQGADGREAATADADGDDEDGTAGGRSPVASAADRRRAAGVVVGLWRDVARDLLVVRIGVDRDVRDPALLDDLRAASTAMGDPPAEPGADPGGRDLADFLRRLDSAAELLEANVRPELILDSLVLAWPAAA